MNLILPYSICRRIVTAGGIPWSQVKLINQRRWYSNPQRMVTSTPSTSHGSQGQTAPENFDGGDYDEEKNEEYEQEATARATRYRRIKKIASSALFVSVLGYVGYSRRGKREEIKENLRNVKLLNDDGLFQGSEKRFCLYEDPRFDGARVVLPLSIVKDGTMKKIADFRINSGDVIVASFPKAGTTWVQELVFLIKNDLNFAEAKKEVLESRFPFLEYPYPGLSTIEKMPTPRMIKTHLPFEFLPTNSNQAKIIYVTRNPKDTVVSYYHFSRMFTMSNFVGTFEDFLRKFENNELPYCPFFDHVESYNRHKDDANLLIVTYEDLIKDPGEIIQKIASFLGKTLTEDDTNRLIEHTSFQNMSRNASVNYEHWDDIGFRNKKEAKFMRKGKVGDWKNYLSKEENARFDSWIASNNKVNFPFVFEV